MKEPVYVFSGSTILTDLTVIKNGSGFTILTDLTVIKNGKYHYFLAAFWKTVCGSSHDYIDYFLVKCLAANSYFSHLPHIKGS
jgi:hypothetical protein